MDFVDEYYAGKDLSLLKKLTLIIPTYNRNYYLSRCLWYHAHFPFGEIIIADSSPEEKKVVNRETVGKVRGKFGVNIRYLEYEPETEKYGGDVGRKWGDAVQHVETEYSLICTDKQFKMPVSLQKCIQYLELHDDYLSCGGKEYLLYCKYDLKDMTGYYLIQGDPTRTSEAMENGLERFIHAFIEVEPMHNNLILQTMRTKIHKYSYQKLIEYEIDNAKFGEILLGYIIYLSGKYHCLENDSFVIRDNRGIQQDKRKNFSIKSPESSASRYQDVYINSNETSPAYIKFKLYLLEELISIAKIDRKNAEMLIDTTIKNRVFACKESPTIRSKVASKFPIALDIWYCLPHSIQNLSNNFTKKMFNFTLPTDRIKDIGDNIIDVRLITRIIAETADLLSLDIPVPITR